MSEIKIDSISRIQQFFKSRVNKIALVCRIKIHKQQLRQVTAVDFLLDDFLNPLFRIQASHLYNMLAMKIADSKPMPLALTNIPTLLTNLPTPSSSINPSIHSLPHFFSFCLRAASTFRLSILVSILTQNAGSQLVKSIFWNAVCIWIKRRNIITKCLWACFYNAVVMCLTKCYCRTLLNIFSHTLLYR